MIIDKENNTHGNYVCRCLDLQAKKVKVVTRKDEDGRACKKQRAKETACPFFKQSLIDNLRNLALNEVQDVEDLIKNGKKLKACPYYASRKASEDAQIVLVPYNTVLHDATRKANGMRLLFSLSLYGACTKSKMAVDF